MDYAAGVKEIWKKDEDFQLKALEAIVKKYRKISEPSKITAMVSSMRATGMFFVPNNEYLRSFFGFGVTQMQEGYYIHGFCRVNHTVLLPMHFLDGSVPAFISYDPERINADTKSVVKYSFPSDKVIRKSRYFYILPKQFAKAIIDGYICIVDGLFDQHTLELYGYNAVALCGSALSEWHKYYLSFIKYKIVVPDNDNAGSVLADTFKSQVPNSCALWQQDAKDADDFFKSAGNPERFARAFKLLQQSKFLLDIKIPHKIVPSTEFIGSEEVAATKE